MAIKPTIFKFAVSVSDLDRNYYETLNLTVAQHPSESLERMTARVLAYCLNSNEDLVFTKGLSSTEEPDIWQHSLDNQLLLWIDVGEPAFERTKKATRLAQSVKIYSFNSKSDVWWQQVQSVYNTLTAEVYRFPWEPIQSLAGQIQRTMEFTVTISDSTLFVATESDNVEIPCEALQYR